MNQQEEYDRLHYHMMAIARERDWLQLEVKRLTDEVDHFCLQGFRWMAMMHDLATHLGNALYSDEWRTREYAIALYYLYEMDNPEHVRDIDTMVDL